jgi:hypothetical protein
MGISLGLALLVLIAVLRRARFKRPPKAAPRREGPAVTPALLASLRRVEALWTRLGCPRPPHRAPLEHAEALPPDRVSAEVRALSREVVACFYRGAYGGRPASPAELARLSTDLDRLSQ